MPRFAPALLIIDIQNDFLPLGSLAIANGDAILDPIVSMLRYPWKTVITTQDWHPQNHCSFAENHGVPPFSQREFTHPEDPQLTMVNTVWPVHCVQGTTGAALHSRLEEGLRAHGVEAKKITKGTLQDREYYSCFSDCWKLHHTGLDEWLASQRVTDVVVVGLAYDFCVLHSALDSAAAGYPTRVVKDASKSVSPSEETDRRYRHGGVEIVSVDGMAEWFKVRLEV